MPRSARKESTARPAGYEELLARFRLQVIPSWHRSFVGTGTAHRIERRPGATVEIYPKRYWPGDSLGDHLEFALKYDGVNLAILDTLFRTASSKDILAGVKAKPTGKYARQLWFLHEFLTGKTLPLKDLEQGNYVDLLDPKIYYTIAPVRRIRRHRINDNLLGIRGFCPTIRRTETLRGYQEANLTERCEKVVSSFSPQLLERALNYLYTKETKSSFEIEHIKPNPTRTERFIALLQLAEKEDFCEKAHLIRLQNRIVDPRFQDSDYRKVQNYVGESVAPGREKVHFACPKPQDLKSLMYGLLSAHERMEKGGVHPVAHAAAIAYGFVFLHPFEDGNGRIHRFLIHNILARRGFTPEGIMFPVSASMLKNRTDYDASLEAFSRPLMPLVDYSIDERGRMSIDNETATWYAYIDMTSQAEALFRFIERAIDEEIVEELSFRANYGEARKAIQEIVDMPDRRIDLFIRSCLENHGRLSARARKRHFEFLSDDEVAELEKEIQAIYGGGR